MITYCVIEIIQVSNILQTLCTVLDTVKARPPCWMLFHNVVYPFSFSVTGKAVGEEAVTLTTIDAAILPSYVIQFVISVGCNNSDQGNELSAI